MAAANPLAIEAQSGVVRQDVSLAVGVVAILTIMFLPLPSILIDAPM